MHFVHLSQQGRNTPIKGSKQRQTERRKGGGSSKRLLLVTFFFSIYK